MMQWKVGSPGGLALAAAVWVIIISPWLIKAAWRNHRRRDGIEENQ